MLSARKCKFKELRNVYRAQSNPLQLLRRNITSKSDHHVVTTQIHYEPPLPIRVALVSTSKNKIISVCQIHHFIYR